MIKLIFEMRSDTTLEEELSQNGDFQKILREIMEKLDGIERMGWKPEQWKQVDEVLNLHSAKEWEYGKTAYCLGFRDAVRLILESLVDTRE